MSIVGKIKRAVRGDVDPKAAALEVLRRGRAAMANGRERDEVKKIAAQPARLSPSFAAMQPAELLTHFGTRSSPSFLPGFSVLHAGSYRRIFPDETVQLLADANEIVNAHAWPIMGLGKRSFGNPIEWHRDLLTGTEWPRSFHADIDLTPGGGSDVRVVWEVNRLQHFLTLARAYAVNGDERFAREFLEQFAGWSIQNPYGNGVNWSCAMEVALRSINLLGAFEIFRHSTGLDQRSLSTLLATLDQHGTFIREHLEFSHIATSNHYLSDVVGLVWLGIMLPELEAAEEWRQFGLRELLREMDKQVLEDGADYEASTGYHRFVLELFLYTFILCRTNSIEIEQRYWVKLRAMLDFVRGYLRPDGRAPLIGDSDGGQVFPIRSHDANDHAYLLSLGAVIFQDANLLPSKQSMPEEVAWVLAEAGVAEYQKLHSTESGTTSRAYRNAGICVLGTDDLYLLFNATGTGINGRGSHGHNDALSIEVSACGTPFIVDPGTFVYSADPKERHRFRSTSYHSTVEIDGEEQNTIDEDVPFVIGDEARPRLLSWEPGEELIQVSAEHYGYKRLPNPVTHRRTVTLNKRERRWMIDDELTGSGAHDIAVRFHLNSGLKVAFSSEEGVWATDEKTGAKLLIASLDLEHAPEFESQFTSVNYLEKTPSTTLTWKFRRELPCKFSWTLVPSAW